MNRKVKMCDKKPQCIWLLFSHPFFPELAARNKLFQHFRTIQQCISKRVKNENEITNQVTSEYKI
uniref:Uncharacterized protein n=1 Tax=Octopus bimaculoides TaxID=37653 RepID=A0A0L8HC68_OCTBM